MTNHFPVIGSSGFQFSGCPQRASDLAGQIRWRSPPETPLCALCATPGIAGVPPFESFFRVICGGLGLVVFGRFLSVYS